MRFYFAIVVLCPLSPRAQAQFTQQGSKLVGSGGVGQGRQGYSVAVSGDGNTAIVGGPDDNNSAGAAWVYTRSGGIWTQQGNKLVGSGAVGAALQGYSVAVSADGNTAITTGTFDNGGIGAAWVFTRSGGMWTQQGPKLVGSGAVGTAGQGSSVALSGDGNTAIVGGAGDNNGVGAAWVFTRSGGVWTQQGNKFVGTGAVGMSGQGISAAVSEDGNTALVGGRFDDNEIGAAWVFTRSGGVWTQQGNKLVGTGGVGYQDQGFSVSISGDGNTALVGAPDDNHITGAVWVFARSVGVWTQQGTKLVGTGATEFGFQGWSVATSGDGNTFIEGGVGDHNQAGAIWVFTRSGGVWTQQGSKLVGAGAVGASSQGSSVSLSADGNTAIEGGPLDNNDSGAAWVFAQSWKTLTNTYPGGGAGPCLVLTDGTVACNNSQSNSNQWYRLTPDRTGSYLNGTWSAMPNMPYQPVFYASAVLPNGQLIIQGGEYLNGVATWTNQGAVYEPKTNSWTSVTCNVIPSGQLGNSQSVIFPDGTFMIANISNAQVATAAPGTDFTTCGNNCYTLLSPTGKDDPNYQEGWTLLADGTILTVDSVTAPKTQIYTEGTPGSWSSSGSTTCNLEDLNSQALGPQVLRPDGTVVTFGAGIASGHLGACTAIYNTTSKTWSAGPDFPAGLNVDPGPASLLLNGNVLVMASPGAMNNGAQFFEWDGANLNAAPSTPNGANDSSFAGHMVILPTGEIMFTDYTQDVELYATPGGTFQDSWRPVITGIPFLATHAKLVVNGTYEIDGLQFNGLSQGAAFGNNLQTASNYPLVRATQLFGSGNTLYFKTHDHSSMGVATGSTPVHTFFDIGQVPTGLYSLVVVANGIPSQPKLVTIGCTQGAIVNSSACHGGN